VCISAFDINLFFDLGKNNTLFWFGRYNLIGYPNLRATSFATGQFYFVKYLKILLLEEYLKKDTLFLKDKDLGDVPY
jgi:hypothetical protein